MNRSLQMLSFAVVAGATIFAISVFSSSASGTRVAVMDPSEIGTVDVFALIDIGLMVEEIETVRAEYTAQADGVIGPMYQYDAQLKQQMSTMAQDDPNSAAVYQEYQGNYAQLQDLQARINSGYQQLIAGQISELYKTIYAAANEVASTEGYVYVFASRADSNLVQVGTIQGVTQEILARPMVLPPQATDITEMVRIKMELPTKEEQDAARAIRQAEAEATAAAAAAESEQPTQGVVEVPVEVEQAEPEAEPAVEPETEPSSEPEAEQP